MGRRGGKGGRTAVPEVCDSVGFRVGTWPHPCREIIVKPAIVLGVTCVVRPGNGHRPAIRRPSASIPTRSGYAGWVHEGNGFLGRVGSALVRPIKVPTRGAQTPLTDRISIRGGHGGRGPEMLASPEVQRLVASIIQKGNRTRYSQPRITKLDDHINGRVTRLGIGKGHAIRSARVMFRDGNVRGWGSRDRDDGHRLPEIKDIAHGTGGSRRLVGKDGDEPPRLRVQDLFAVEGKSGCLHGSGPAVRDRRRIVPIRPAR